MIGRRIGRYEVIGEVGRGGMGVVYQARDAELTRIVALKALPSDAVRSSERRKRFLQEARSASSLNHPNIVTIHDILSDDESDWIVMEYIDGPTLREIIAKGALPIPKALSWAVEIADALAVAHQAGIIHRDIKPGNVMIDRAGRSRVLDFGLAKLQPGAESATQAWTMSSPLTRLGSVLGTLEYMSPEQAMGKPVDARSDVFSLGAMLYEMLTGAAPFVGPNPPAIIHAVVYEQQAPPESLRPELPERACGIVQVALAKDPANRFQTMAQMRDALRASELEPQVARRRLSRRSTVIPPIRPPSIARRAASRRRVVAAAVVLVGIVAAAIFVSARWGFGPLGREARTAAADSPLPETPYQLFQQGRGLLEHYWRSGYVDQAIESLQSVTAAAPDYVPAYASLAEAAYRKWETERDAIWLDSAAAQAQQALTLDENLTSARLWLGLVMKARGDLEGADEALREVVLRDPAAAQAYRGLADIEMARGRLDAAEALHQEAIERAPESPELRSAYGVFLYDAGRYEDALAEFNQAVTVAPDFIFGYRNAAAALHMLGRYDRAAEQLQRALEIRADAPTYSNLGTLYFFQGLYPQALAAFQRAIDLGANDYQIWGNLGDAYRETPGRENDARRAYRRSVQLLDEAIAGSPGDVALESRKALLLAKQGAVREATELADRVVGAATDPSSLYRLAVAYELVEHREQALETLAAALQRGFSESEIRKNPELTRLRSDPRYHLMLVDVGEEQ